MTTARQRRHRLLIMAHGAGSSAGFLGRAFPPAACGMPVEHLEDRTAEVTQITERLLAAARGAWAEDLLPVLGGVSIGAHAAAFAALAAPPDLIAGCVLVMPAWNGPCRPDSPTALAAAEVARLGAAGVLQRLTDDPLLAEDWVTDELRRAWRDRPTLASELASASRGAAPTAAELAAMEQPALVLAMADDPVHPLRVARTWARALPDAELDVIARSEPAGDRAIFGRRVGAWAARRLSGPR